MAQRFLSFGGLALALAAAACSSTIDAPPGANDSTAGTAGQGGSGTAGTGSAGTPGSGGTSAGTAGTAGVAGTAGTGPNIPAGSLKLDGSPNYYRVVRLTNEQWTNSVQAVLKLPAAPTYAEGFQDPVSGTTDFTNNELLLDVDSRRWSDFRAAAQQLADQVTSDQARLSSLYSGTDPAGFISAMGLRTYRRPLTAAEVTKYRTIFDQGSAMTGTKSAFAKGASVVLETMLQSPFFLYRTELAAAGTPLSSYEMAAKLSLWLRDTTPDDALLQAAGTPGNLDTAEGAATAARQMLNEPAATEVMRKFHGEFLHFDSFEHLSKVGVSNYNTAINDELAEASFLFFNRIFTQGLGVKDIFLSTTGFVGPNMASLYGGGAVAPGNFAERELGGGRVGYFTQLPFLMLYAHNGDPDSIHRGVTMSLDVLCAPLGPPADVIPPLPAVVPGQTNRQRVDLHTSACGMACHNAMINPLGFAFENYDGMGQYRDTERNGNDMLPIDSSGSFEFVDGEKLWNNAAELMDVLAGNPQTHLCYSKKLAGYGLQRDIIEADLSLLGQLASVSATATGSVKDVIVDLVRQDAFRVRAQGLP